MAVGVVSRFKQESNHGLLSVRTKKKGHGREVAVSEGSIVVKYVEKNLDITKPRTNTGGTSV